MDSSWDHDIKAASLKADKQLVFSQSFSCPVWLLFLPGQPGNGDSDNSDAKGSHRTVSRVKLKYHHASQFPSDGAVGTCHLAGLCVSAQQSNTNKQTNKRNPKTLKPEINQQRPKLKTKNQQRTPVSTPCCICKFQFKGIRTTNNVTYILFNATLL